MSRIKLKPGSCLATIYSRSKLGQQTYGVQRRAGGNFRRSLILGAKVREPTADQTLNRMLRRRRKHLHAQWVKSGFEQRNSKRSMT